MCWAASTHRTASQDDDQQSGLPRATECMDFQHDEDLRSFDATLEQKEQRVMALCDSLRDQLRAASVQLRKIRMAREVLRRGSQPKAAHKTRLSREVVSAAVQRALESGPKSYEQLKTAVLAAAREAGVLGTGVHLILQQLVADPQIEQVDGNYRRKRSAQSAS